MNRLPLPVQQIADWEKPGETVFRGRRERHNCQHKPVLDRRCPAQPKGILREDVALFARAVSPFNRARTVTICSGMYGRGTYGVVRALTDAASATGILTICGTRFSDSETYCILTRVPIVEGVTLTPDWTTGDYMLFEWPG